MIGWLYRMIVGRFVSCRHSWETIRETEMMKEGYDLPVKTRWTLRCKSCGDITYRNT